MLESEAAPCLRASVVRPLISAAPKEYRRITPHPEIIVDGSCSAGVHAGVAARFAACTPRVRRTTEPRSHGGSETVQPDPAHSLTLYARRVLMFESEAAPCLRRRHTVRRRRYTCHVRITETRRLGDHRARPR
jgi:hypothetical protein